MNMISTGAFLNEMDASNKQPTVADKFAAVWEKKNAKAARAGGVSLMALSLAACGGSSSTTTTTTTTDTTTTVTPAVDAAKSITLTTGTDNGASFTGGSGDDTFSATHATFNALDELAGGAGSDTLTIVNSGGANYTAAVAKVKEIETINITTQNATSDGTAEVATVTVGALQDGQYMTVAGQTVTATADLTAAQVASVLTGGTVSGGTLSGTLTAGYTKAAGTNTDEVTYTATTVGDKADLAITGNSQSDIKQVNVISFTAAEDATDTLAISMTINGTTVTADTVAKNATAAVQGASIANAINGYAGANIATVAGATVQVVSDTVLNIANLKAVSSDDGAAGSVTAFASTNTLAASKTTYQVTTAPSDNATISFVINGTTVTTAAHTQTTNTTSAASLADAANIIAAAINTYYGATIATVATATVTIDSGDVGLAIGGFSASAGTIAGTQSNVTLSSGKIATDATTISTVDGTAAVTAQKYTTSVDASKFTDATTMASVNSTGDVSFSNMVSTQAGVVSGNTVLTNGNTTFGHKATATSFDIDITGGTTAGDITATGSAATSASISSSGEKNTVGTIDLAGAKTITIDAATALTATQIDTTATSGTMTITGAGAVSIGTIDAGIATVTASGNSGGLTATLNTGIKTYTGTTGADVITTAALGTTSTVAAGDGADTLIIGTATDLDSATEAAKYTGFETVRALGDFNASLMSDAINFQLAGAGTLSQMTAAQAGNVQFRADGAYGVSLGDSTGTSDSVTINLGTGSKSTAAVSITGGGLTANGFETINLNTNEGPTATTGANQTSTIAAFTADKATSIVLTGSSFDLTNIATTKAVTIDASGLTGDGAATAVGLKTAGDAVSGSTIIGSDHADTFVITAEAQTYNGGAGDDTFTISSADPTALTEADGTTDLVLDGGASTKGDTLKFLDTTATDTLTLTDVDFTKVSNMEKLVLGNTGNLSLTTGSGFNAAFASGVTITTGALAEASDVAIAAGLSTVDMKITIDAALIDGDGANEDTTITTGSGNDTVVYDGDATYVAGTSGGTITIDTNAGDDSITVNVGTLTDEAANQAISVDGGAGQDTITFSKVNGGDTGGAGGALGNAIVIVTSGQSTTTAYDTVKGFDVATTTDIGDKIDFSGSSAAVTDFTNSVDKGVIKTHSVSNGVVTFDDAAIYATALVINSTNLSDVIDYLATNTDNEDVAAFLFDSNGNGTNDSTMVYHNGEAGKVDSLVLLDGISVLGVSTSLVETAGYIAIA